jgi:dienelactone hydrolase
MPHAHLEPNEQAVQIPTDGTHLEGNLFLTGEESGLVLFAHGSGSSRHSPRNRYVAQTLHSEGLGALLMDLLTPEEEAIDARSGELRFDMGLLADRLIRAIDWLSAQPRTSHLKIGCFGASSGAGAALIAAAERPDAVSAVVSRGGRPDLAGDALHQVRAATLLIVGARDFQVVELNKSAFSQLDHVKEKRLELIPGATHLFQEPGTLEQVARLAAEWFREHLAVQANMTPPEKLDERLG